MAEMQDIPGGMNQEVAEQVQAKEKVREILFVTKDTPQQQVLDSDAEGVRIIFEHELGVFHKLPPSIIDQLSHETRVAYHVSEALNAKHDPANDEMQQKLKVMEMRNNRSLFEKQVRSTVQSSVATKKLQAYVGHGFSPMWTRVDKLEERLAKGYQVVRGDDPDCYAGVTPTSKIDPTTGKKDGGIYEIRSRPGEPELILMRIPNDMRKKMLDDKQEATKRLAAGLDNTGKREIREAGGTPIEGRDELAWQDRK